jgi:two-component system chemotaxis sensor kinase CheA
LRVATCVMPSEDNSFTEFLDDYFSESEEHLGSIRRQLVVMEDFVNRDRIDPQVLDELFRAFHSLKGLSGMVGFHEAEQVIHAMEGALRDVKRANAGPTENVMAAFTAGTRMTEQVIAARRAHQPVPDIAAVLSLISSIVAQQVCLWDFEFRPSVELSARGINVTSIKSRLQEIGQVLNTTPHVLEGGRITFAFIVASDADESRFSGWQFDGLTATRRTLARDAAEDAGTESVAPPSSLRIEMKRLDHLMTLVADLVVSRGHVDESLRRLEAILPASAWRELQESNLRLQRELRDLREGLMHIRMIPIAQVFERMQFVIRGLARENGKDVRLELSGQETEIDKVLVERMMDPLLHMVRNAVSHGLEPTEERIAAGKTAEGHLRLSAWTEAENVVIELEDDGRGVDFQQIANRARTLGSHDIATPDNLSVLQLLCEPGFSTREEADLGAGRGVGMSVVKTTISAMGGTLAMDTQPGKGTRFKIRVPLTLVIMQALVVYVDDQQFAVPRSAIHEVLRVESQTVTRQDGAEVIPYGAGVLPLVHLRHVFDISRAKAGPAERSTFHVFVTAPEFGAVAVAVDRVGDLREIVVRSVEDSLASVPGIAGATDLGDGRPVLILDVAAIVGALGAQQVIH